MPNMYKGALLSIATILCWAISNVFLRYCLLTYGCNQFAIACSNVLFSGLAMIALGNRHADIRKIIANWKTWIFGALQIFRNLFMIMAFVYISSTQANLLANMEIVMSVILAWALFGRRPSEIDVMSMLFILGGCFILVAGLPLSVMCKVTLFVGLSAFLNVLRTIIAEVHDDNKVDLPVKDRLSLTGWIMFVSGLTFIIVAMLLSTLVAFLPETITADLPFLAHLPKPMEYLAFKNIACGFINGVCIYALSMYCYLYAVSLSNSEYFMMFRSTQAVFTYGVELIVSSLTVLPFAPLTMTDKIAAVTIILSSGCMVLMRTRRGKKLKQKMDEAFSLGEK